ncbi:hypothetical protein H6P81_006362 [Aristolochia fimbriata]|uniref:Retrotransposon gag domain-containing protein n=1 Tax=Aristolochia fimbriata TaxID=158543 RepID=A0AAV7EXA7_ARIFI|nr:hypothetical protein H6P81_006362 [Aristolochia fimbriata]
MENLEVSGIDGEQAPIPRRTLEDYVTPSPNTNWTRIITPTIQANNFDIKPQIIAMLQNHYQFSGLAHEDPNEHLERFLDPCATFKYNGVLDDAIRLRLFKFTWAGRAKTWLDTLLAGSIVTWEDLQKKFLGKYFPRIKTIKLRNKISQFVQEPEEHLSEAWERFIGLLKRCPNHKIELWRQIEIFYNGLTINTRSMIDVASGGSISNKTPEEVYELTEEMTTNMYQYPVERSAKKAAEIYKLESSTNMQAQLEALQKQIASLQQQSNPVVASTMNYVEEDPLILNAKVMMDPYNNTYNPGWRNHPKFSWNNNNQTRHPPPKFQPLQVNTQQKEEQMISKLAAEFEAEKKYNRAVHAEIQTIKSFVPLLNSQMIQLMKDLSAKPQGALPSNSEVNLRDQVKGISLRSGKTLKDPQPKE